MTDTKQRVAIDVWSDYVCPFCYLELPVLEALEQEYGDLVTVEWRAFELRPEPVPTLDPAGDYLRTTWARAVYPMAEERGLTLRLPPVQPRSRLAHEAAAFARARDPELFARLHHALFRAFFEHGRDIGDPQELQSIGATVGLPATELRAALEAGEHRDEVLDDEVLASDLGLEGVPALVLRRDGESMRSARLLSGAQPLDVVRRAVEVVARGSGAAVTRSGQPLRRRLPLGGVPPVPPNEAAASST